MKCPFLLPILVPRPLRSPTEQFVDKPDPRKLSPALSDSGSSQRLGNESCSERNSKAPFPRGLLGLLSLGSESVSESGAPTAGPVPRGLHPAWMG
jgi:hypothetical protein